MLWINSTVVAIVVGIMSPLLGLGLKFNYMLLIVFFLVVNKGIDEKTKGMMRNFLEDKITLEKLNLEDL